MTTELFRHRLAVCSWSLQAATPQELIARLKETGVRRVQLALDPLREQPQIWGAAGQLLHEHGFTVISGMFGCVGEDYTTLETIRATGGIAPDHTWAENWENIQETAEIAAALGLRLATFHAGFLPHEESDPSFPKLTHRLNLIADVFAAKGMDVAFETGQERAPVLHEFLKKLGRANVGVNFDPANMILYDQGNPIDALRELSAWLKQIHIKDAVRTEVPGTWGQEVTAGTGQVPWKEFFTTLREVKFTGHCSIEREAGSNRVGDIRAARELVENLDV